MASSLSIVNRFIDTLNIKIPSFLLMINALLGLYSVNCVQSTRWQTTLSFEIFVFVDTIFSIVCTEFGQQDGEHSSLVF